jgi:hypothetical protein
MISEGWVFLLSRYVNAAIVIVILLACGLDAQIATTTALISVTPPYPTFGQAVLLTAQVLPTPASGTVSFIDSGVLVGVGALDSEGIAKTTTLTLAPGSHSLSAIYGGNPSRGISASKSSAESYFVSPVPASGFAAAVDYRVGAHPDYVTVGDFNGDGNVDLLVGSNILLGDGNGHFRLSGSINAGFPLCIAVGDFNADGIEDLAVANGVGSVSVLLGNGDGTFQEPLTHDIGPYAYLQSFSVSVGDFNGDGKEDLAVANNGGVSVLLGNGDGTFKPTLYYGTLMGSAQSVAVGDFNGDNIPDLALSHVYGISILLGNGDGTFQAGVSYGKGNGNVLVADFNGDGKPDLAEIDNGVTVSILLGNGDGSFRSVSDVYAGTTPCAIMSGDLNGDGRPDLAVADCNANQVLILLGNGDGTFQPGIAYGVGMQPRSLALGDFNGDGRADLATANIADGDVSVLLGMGRKRGPRRPIW